MAASERQGIIYWDASGILSALFTDTHSHVAKQWAHREAVHLLSTLAYTETCAVISRFWREGILAHVLIDAAYETLHGGMWRRLSARPGWQLICGLSQKWPLQGADLWHLATAKALQEEVPELLLLTFDAKLRNAAIGEELWEGR